MKPLLKWVGGKRWLIPEFEKKLNSVIKFNKDENSYFEPFVGAGAIFFRIKPKNAVINDYNWELINLYTQVKEKPLELINILKEMVKKLEVNQTYYYEIRNWDRSEKWINILDIEKAARTIFLNKSCFNGLYRVNQSGQFNVPIGKNNISNILDIDNLLEVSKYLNNNNIIMKNDDFESVGSLVKSRDLLYFDPPYDPIDSTAKFTEYTNKGFTRNDQIRLKIFSDYLIREKKANVIISNSSTEFIKKLYSNELEYAKSEVKYYIIEVVHANRNINSNPKKREKIKEVLIYSRGKEENE
ncbi:Dam family site-specific DNA-(adenine-N6)-methyltransferase [Spiroplasma sp. SV19]|uniref:DNA adenine methylase n=1 Tax=Spiroplasma sp. SV19 TaxID=2570468 RepID=UPI0024B86117|nr:Dam family site-specific DNA-(adenine-N6)-methyltransferase [Spiroplasma sp. SV19]